MTLDTSQPRRPSLSIVVPIRDEEANLPELHRRLREAAPADAELILVDDGSADRSRELIAGIVASDPLARGVGFLRSFGKSQALAAGFARCRGEIVATIDADLQEDPRDIVRLAKSLRQGSEGAGLDLVTGWRRVRRDPPRKVLASRVFNALARWMCGVPLRDINCGLKVMRRCVVEEMQLEGGYHRFIPLLAHWKGFRVGELEVEHAPRRHGRSRYGHERILHGIIDLIVLVFLERYERRPSRLFLGCGSLLFLAGFGISLYLTVLKWLTGTIQSKYPLLTLGVLLVVVGVQVVSTGLLAELVAHRRRGFPDARLRVEEIRAAETTAAEMASDESRDARRRREQELSRRQES